MNHSETVGSPVPKELFLFSDEMAEERAKLLSAMLEEKRFAEAERLLLQSDIPVSAIAEAIGYENNSFFHRRFREQYGTSPSRWRKRGDSE